jgi:hypothetical protein
MPAFFCGFSSGSSLMPISFVSDASPQAGFTRKAEYCPMGIELA